MAYIAVFTRNNGYFCRTRHRAAAAHYAGGNYELTDADMASENPDFYGERAARIAAEGHTAVFRVDALRPEADALSLCPN